MREIGFSGLKCVHFKHGLSQTCHCETLVCISSIVRIQRWDMNSKGSIWKRKGSVARQYLILFSESKDHPRMLWQIFPIRAATCDWIRSGWKANLYKKVQLITVLLSFNMLIDFLLNRLWVMSNSGYIKNKTIKTSLIQSNGCTLIGTLHKYNYLGKWWLCVEKGWLFIGYKVKFK